jgi:hypothetical protein
MGHPQLIAFFPLRARLWLLNAPASGLSHWLVEGATSRSSLRAWQSGLSSSFRSQSAAVPRPPTPSARARAAPLRFPTTLSQPMN